MSIPSNFREHLIKEKNYLNKFLIYPDLKQIKTLLLNASDDCLSTLLEIVYVVFNRFVEADENLFRILKERRKFSFLSKRFRPNSLEEINKLNRQNKVKILLHLRLVLTEFLKVFKRKDEWRSAFSSYRRREIAKFAK